MSGDDKTAEQLVAHWAELVRRLGEVIQPAKDQPRKETAMTTERDVDPKPLSEGGVPLTREQETRILKRAREYHETRPPKIPTRMTVTRVEEADARTLSGPDSEIVTAAAGSESVTFEQHPAGTWRIGDRLTVTIERERKR